MVKINVEVCIGCGACTSVCPEGFEIINGVVELKNAKAKGIKEAISVCPVDALI